MSVEDNKQVVQEFFAAGERGDMDACFSLLADDITWTNIGSTAFSGSYVGKQALIEELIGPLFGQLKNGISSTIENLVGEGDLVVAQPSPFVRDVMTKVGIDKLIDLHDDDASATKAIVKHLNKRELTGEAPVDQEKVLVTFRDDTRNQMLGGKKVLVCKIANVDGNKMQFLWSGAKAGFNADQSKTLFFEGGEMHLKFQVKMIKKSFFEFTAEGAGVEPAGDDETVRVTAKYKKISDADREALGQFASDMAFFKTQLPGN